MTFRAAFLAGALSLACAASAQTLPSRTDSGWVSLWNGADLAGLFVYVGGKGYTETKDQGIFAISDGMIKANGPYALLTTAKEYSHYRMRIEYRFDSGAAANANAGAMIHFDNTAARTVKAANRPRSIEINFRRDNAFPASLWAALGYGPYITTTVQAGTQKFLPKDQGGVEWTCEPWDADKRVVQSALPLQENPPGQWNRLDADIRGDSGAVFFNGKLRTEGWHFQGRGSANDSSRAHRIKISQGGVSVQSEGFPVAYRIWEIQELDSVTHIPIHAVRGCTDRTRNNFDPHAVIDDGSCASTGLGALAGSKSGKPAFKGPRFLVDGRKVGANAPAGLGRAEALNSVQEGPLKAP